MRAAFPAVEERVVQHDMAYAAMLTFLPAGLLGLVVASLIGAYMSTISTAALIAATAAFGIRRLWGRRSAAPES